MVAIVEKKPLPIRLLNNVYSIATKAGWDPVKLDKETLKNKAIKATGGLNDFGDSMYEEGLDRLLDAIAPKDNLSGFGRVMASQYIVQLLRHRLNITDYLKKNPEVLDEVIEKPIFIVGAPRTGTTITHHLMSQDKRLRYPFTWECYEMYPPLDPKTMHNDPRIELSRKDCDRAKKLAPNLEAAHPMGPWEAQECALFMAIEFTSQVFITTFNCQDYNTWLIKQDLTWVYERHKMMLQYMQSGGLRPSETWLLKTPAHQSQIDAILKVYPDARFVTTYREPTDVVVSGCSLVGTVIQMAQNEVDWAQLGEYLSWHMEMQMHTNVAQRQKHADKADQFIDLSMQEVIKDPVGCVNSIYRQFNIEMTEDVAHAMDTYMQKHALEKRVKHHYSPDDFSIDTKALWPKFQFYRDFYNIEN